MAKLKKRKDGRYQRKITLSDGRQRVVYGRTLAELNAAEDALREQDNAGLQIGDHTLVGEWAKIWIESYKTGLRASTLRMYRGSYNKHVMPVLGSMELQDVRPVHIRAVMRGIADKSESTQHKVLLTMRQLFETARLNNLILRNPADGIKITPRQRQSRKEYLTRDEAEQLMQRVTEPRAKAFCALCLYAVGYRPRQHGDRARRDLSRRQYARPAHGAEEQGFPPYSADPVQTAGNPGSNAAHQRVCRPRPLRRRDDQYLL